jgi:predicted RNA-binding Zn ribbon-like protein
VSSNLSSNPPHDLDLVIDFVNTLDAEAQTDELAGEQASSWFSGRELLDPAREMSDAERERAVELREALRALMLANNGGEPDEQAIATLDRVAARGQLGVAFGAGGDPTLTPRADDYDGALARLLVPVARAGLDGTWSRVKACRAPDCQWAFYDRSRNRSGVWCEMAVCGNRTKVRSYRERSQRQR